MRNYGVTGNSHVAQTVKRLSAMQEPGFDPWLGKIPWRRKWPPTPIFLLENSMDRGAWWATVHGVAKSQTKLSNFTSRIKWGFSGDTSDKEPTCQLGKCKRCRFNPWVRKIPWRRASKQFVIFLAYIYYPCSTKVLKIHRMAIVWNILKTVSILHILGCFCPVIAFAVIESLQVKLCTGLPSWSSGKWSRHGFDSGLGRSHMPWSN